MRCCRAMRKLLAGLVLLAMMPVLLNCATLSVPDERKLGRKTERELRKELDFIRDPVVVGYIEQIGRRIVAQTEPQPYEYRFYVVEDDEINAFALPAGYVYVHTGTILKARNASELAGVIAHEVGHVALRHTAESYNRQRNTGIAHQTLVFLAAIFGGSYAAGAANLGGGLAGVAYLNTFSREHETAADTFAIEILPKIGINPEGMVTFFETLAEEGGPGVPTFLSSHPSPNSRRDETQALIDAQQLSDNLRDEDGGRLEIIQRRIRLLTGDTQK